MEFGYYSPAYAFISCRQPTAIELNISRTKNYIFLRVKNNIKIGADKIADVSIHQKTRSVFTGKYLLPQIDGMRPFGSLIAFVSIHRKTRTAKPFAFFGGDSRDRTDDLLNAIQALYQLSYTPVIKLSKPPVN